MTSVRLLVAAGVLMVSASAFAQQGKNSGFYVEGTVGRSDFDVNNSSSWNIDKTDTSWGLIAGYNFNENIAVEGGYRDLGEVKGTASGTLSGTLYGLPFTATGTLTASGDAKGWLIGPRLNLPVSEQATLYVRAGLYRWDSDIKATVNAAYNWGGTAYAANASASKNYAGSDAYWGLGANFNVNKQWGFGLGYTAFKIGDDIDTDVKSIDANLFIRF